MPSIDMSGCDCCDGGGGGDCWCIWEWDGAQWNFRADLADCPMNPGRAGPGACVDRYCVNVPPFEPGTFVGELFQTPCIQDPGPP